MWNRPKNKEHLEVKRPEVIQTKLLLTQLRGRDAKLHAKLLF
jgi:hypothetical protein